MTYTLPRHVAIWIDHRQAILLLLEPDPFDGSVPHRPSDGESQDRIDARQYPVMEQYYDAVLNHLEPADEILILGPGRAKRELRQRIEQHDGQKGTVVGLHHASRPADVELIFPIGEIRRSENVEGVPVYPLIPRPNFGPPARPGT